MEELFRKFQPWDIEGVTRFRLGREGDGGYIVPKELTLKCNSFLSFGVGDDYSFDQDLAQLVDKPVYMYDHTVSVNPSDPRLIFVKKGIAKQPSEDMITVPITQAPVLVKMDIEGAEWDILENLNVAILVAEIHGLFHLTTPAEEGIERARVLGTVFDRYLTFHTHRNNRSPSGEWGRVSLSDTVEATFVNRDWLKGMGCVCTKSTTTFPIPNLDSACLVGFPDPPITF